MNHKWAHRTILNLTNMYRHRELVKLRAQAYDLSSCLIDHARMLVVVFASLYAVTETCVAGGGIGTGLVQAKDHDRDGRAELLIGVSASPSELGIGTADTTNSKKQIGLVLYSPGKRRCLRRFKTEHAIGSGNHPFDIVETAGSESIVVCVRDRQESDDGKLVRFALESGESSVEASVGPLNWGNGGPDVWILGADPDTKETIYLIRHSHDALRRDQLQYRFVRVIGEEVVSRERYSAGAVQVIEDTDGDGVKDFGISTRASHQIRSGLNGAVLFELETAERGKPSGGATKFISLADRDGDNLPELLFIRASNVQPHSGENDIELTFEVYSAANSEEVLHSWSILIEEETRWTPIECHDHDEDGTRDIVILLVEPGGTTPALKVLNGRNGSELMVKKLRLGADFPIYGQLGHSMVLVEDLDKDGHDDLALSIISTAYGAPERSRTVILSATTGDRLRVIEPRSLEDLAWD